MPLVHGLTYLTTWNKFFDIGLYSVSKLQFAVSDIDPLVHIVNILFQISEI